MQENYNVYVIDRRTDISDGYNIYDMANDTAKAMHILGLEKCAVYGVSQGGMIAQVIAIKYPELVSKIALCSAASYITEGAEQILKKWVEFAVNGDKEALALSFGENIYTESYLNKYRKAFIELGKLITDEELKYFVIMAKPIIGFDIRGSLSQIKCPVLVMGGGKDAIFNRESISEIAERTNGELCIYDDRTHSVYDENADVLTRLKNFFDK